MRRFWLLLLLMVLSTQMSWAAVHRCDDTAASEAVLTVPLQAGDYVTEGPLDDQRDAETPAKKSPSAHPCHGVHELMAHVPQVLVEPANESALLSAEPFFRPAIFASRRDRPRWLAA